MKNKFQDLVTSLDILNTVHGGVSEPFISFRENRQGREIHVRVPGIGREALQAEIINNNELSIHYLIPVTSSGTLMHLPQVVFHEVVPKSIDVLKIKATYEENELIVRLPYNKLPNGRNRKINIDGV